MNQGIAGLTPEQIDDVARELQAMVRRGEDERARAWLRRIRRDTGAVAAVAHRRLEPAHPPGCSACGATPLLGKRWCSTHAPVFFRPPEYPPRPRPIDRAREAVLAAPHESAERLALRLGCSPTTIRRAWRELGIAHDRRRSA